MRGPCSGPRAWGHLPPWARRRMDVDTTLGGWPGHSSSSAEPRQALGAHVWRWEDSLRTDVLEALLSVQPTQDSCSPHRPCCATKPTHSASKALQLNRARERLQRHLLYQPWEAWGHPRGCERVTPATRTLVGPAGFSSAVPPRCCPHHSYCPCPACPGHGDSPQRRPGPSAGWGTSLGASSLTEKSLGVGGGYTEP